MDIMIVVLLVLVIVLLTVLIFRQVRMSASSNDIDGRLDDNRQQISQMLQPLKLQLEGFRNEFKDNSTALNNTQNQLTGHIKALIHLNQSITEEAGNLARALKGDSQKRGAWGESILVTILEKSGLLRGIHFETQVTHDEYGRVIRDNSGKLRRPDVVINLPQGRKVVVDSKVTLISYMEYYEAESAEEKKRANKRLIDAFRNHINEISKANYTDVVEGSVELTIMFIPNEGAFLAAFEADPSILDEAAQKHIVVAPPTQMFSILKLIDMMWQSDERKKNTEEIGRVAGELYDKVADFIAKFEKVGVELNHAQEAYKKTLNALQYSKNSVTGKAQELKKMGAKTTKSIPGSYYTEDSNE